MPTLYLGSAESPKIRSEPFCMVTLQRKLKEVAHRAKTAETALAASQAHAAETEKELKALLHIYKQQKVRR